jgi:FkbM family methyltransferase
MNWLCRWPVMPFDAPLGATGNRMRFVCNLGDTIAREACFMGHYEPQETALVRYLLRPDMTFVDVGANWGYYSLIGADLVGERGRVISLEPHPAIFRLLQTNLSKNGLSQVAPVCVAAADRDGEMNLLGFDDRDSNSGTSRLTDEVENEKLNYRVQGRLLEPLLDELAVDEIDLLKMDIEGGEALVLPTLRQALARERFKHILLELHPVALRQMTVSSESLIEMILSFGYLAWRIDHSAKAFRRAAYSARIDPREYLTPLDQNGSLDDWPHLLFVASSVAARW